MQVFEAHSGGLVVGAAMGAFSVAVPDTLVSFLGKVAVGVTVAVISAAAHELAKRVIERIKRR